MTKEVEIEVLRPFNKTPQGELADVGARFPVDETRAQELARSGLARPAKAKREHENKMAPAPANKARPPRIEPDASPKPRAITSTSRTVPKPENEGVEAAAEVERETARTIARSQP